MLTYRRGKFSLLVLYVIAIVGFGSTANDLLGRMLRLNFILRLIRDTFTEYPSKRYHSLVRQLACSIVDTRFIKEYS